MIFGRKNNHDINHDIVSQ